MPLVLTRRGWALLVWAGLLWGSWWVLELRDIWYLPAFLGCLVLASAGAVLVLPTIAGLRTQAAATEMTPRVGGSTQISIRVRQRLALRFRCVAEIKVAGVIMRRPVELTGRQTGLMWTWRASQRGPCSLGVRRLDVQDPLGLLVRRIRSAQAMRQLLVLPARCEDTPELFEVAGGRRSTGQQRRDYGGSASSAAPSGAVRDYRAGDAPRLIHWKQSARQNKLLAKVPELHQPEEEVSLLLVTAESEYSNDQEFERAVSVAATLAERWTQQGYRVRLLAGDQAPLVSASDSELLGHLALVTTDPAHRGDQLLPAEEQVAVVVTGHLSEAAAKQLDSLGTGGAVVATGHSDNATAPPGWRLLNLPAPHLEKDGAHHVRGSYP